MAQTDTGAPLNLTKHDDNDDDWGSAQNDNHDVINTFAAETNTALALKAATADVPVITPLFANLGKVVVGQGDGSGAYVDPQVQGLFPPNTNTTTGGLSGAPINPVLIGGKGADGTLKDIAVANDGSVNVNVITNVGAGGLTDTQLRAVAVPVSVAGVATETTLNAVGTAVTGVTTSLGTDGGSAPSITGTGVRGWLRGVFEQLVLVLAKLNAGIGVTGVFWQATQPVSLAANQSVNVAQVNGVVPLMGAGNTGTGSQRVTIASDQVAIAIKQTPQTSGGCTPATGSIGNTATAVKITPGQLYGIDVYNSNVVTVYLQIWDLATGGVTVGTTPPIISIAIPPGIPRYISLEQGLRAFATAITIAITTTRTGAGNPSNTVDYNAFYV